MSSQPHDFSKYLVCDANLPWPANVSNRLKAEALTRHAKAGVTFVSASLGAVQNLTQTIAYASSERRRLEAQGDVVLVDSAEDVVQAKRDGHLAVGFNFQGTAPLGGHVDMVETYRRLGVRQINIAYNYRNEFGDGCMERTDGGLSRRGLSLIKEMNRVGTIVDLSHSSYRTSLDAMECSEDPVIFSHSNAYGLHPHPRNARDDQIKACAERGGFIGITGVGRFLAKPQDVSDEIVVRHIDYLAQLVGAENVGYGLDHVYYEEQRLREIEEGNANHTLGQEEESPPFYWVQPEQLKGIAASLSNLGYSEQDVRGVMGENYLRVAATIWDRVRSH